MHPVKKTNRSALMYSFFAEYVTQAFTLISVVILARILSPEEYGTYSLAMSMVLLFQHITAFGVGQYIIKAKALNSSELRSAIGFTFISSWGLGFFILLVAPAASTFYELPEIKKILYILSIYFFLTPFGGVTESFLKRGLQFNTIAKIRLLSKAIEIVLTLILAFLGQSYFALAWGMVFGKLIFVIFLYMYKPISLPIKPKFSDFGEIFKFGSKLTLWGVSQQTRAIAPELFVGKLYSIEELGYYSRALGAVKLFNRLVTQAITNVVLPIFAREDRDSLESSYLKTVTYFTALSFSFYGYLYVVATPVINILYGDQWAEAIPLLKVFCIWAAISSLYVFSGQKLLAKGGENKLLYQEVILFPVNMFILSIAAMYGVYYIIYGLLIVSLIEFFMFSRLINNVTGITLLDIWGAIYKSVILSIVVVIITTLSYEYYFIDYGFLNSLLLETVIVFFTWVISIFLLRHPFMKEIKFSINILYEYFKLFKV